MRSCFFFGILKSMNLLESRLPMEKLQALLSERFQIVFSDSSLLDTVDCFYYILGLFGYRSNKLNTTFCKVAP